MKAGHTERKVSLLGCVIDALTFSETLDEIDRLIRDGRPVQHCVVNAAKIALVERDPRLREIVSSCALVNADGQSVVWAARILGRPLPERVAGVDLFPALLGLAEERGYGVYFLGGTPDVVAATAARAQREHPALRIAGHHDGYFGAGDTESVVAEIRAAHPEILFVGMPSPRKEYWLAEHLESLRVPFSWESEAASTCTPARPAARRPGCSASASSGPTA